MGDGLAESATDDDTDPDATVDGHRIRRLDVARVAVVAVAAVAAWIFASAPSIAMLAFGALVLLVGAWPVLREAGENLLERRMTMELSMSIALVAALATGEVFVALVIAAFVLVAEILEEMAVSRGRHAIRDLLDYLPRTAVVRRPTGAMEVPLAELRPGDLVLVNPGGSIPVDGTIVAGDSFVDEATITGEPLPVAKAAGARAYAGTVNQLGALEIRAERVGRDSTFGRIVEAVEGAERAQAPVQKTADRLAGYLVAFALGSAALTFLVTRDPTATISVIIVAGACGVAAGTPLAILGAIGRAARHGSIIKGGRHVEALWTVDTVVLDKTGTLTVGQPTVQAVLPTSGETEASVLAAATVAEARSEHPLGRAIMAYTAGRGIDGGEPDRFTSLPGRGVVASTGGVEVVAGSRSLLAGRGIDIYGLESVGDPTASEVVVAQNGRVLGSIVVADAVRAEAAAAVDALRRMGVRTILLSGDREEAAVAIGARLGVDEAAGDMLPHDKQQRVKTLVTAGRKVAMVGDGINDAPALVEATVGVAMGSGIDVTRESADIVLIGNDLTRFVDTLRLARRSRGVIIQNFVGTIGIDVLGVVLAAFGLFGPLLAAVIHVGSELAFILNSARLVPAPRRSRPRDPRAVI